MWLVELIALQYHTLTNHEQINSILAIRNKTLHWQFNSLIDQSEKTKIIISKFKT